MMRIKLEKQPDWDDRFRGWAAKFVSKNMWRCDPIDDFKDHMQDAYVMFRHVLTSYPAISDPKHIMALFQRSMINDYNDRARYRQRKAKAEISIETAIGEDLKLLDTLGEQNNNGYLNILLSQLPPKVKLAIQVLQDKSKLAYIHKMTSSISRVADSPEKGELTNSALCKIIGLPKGTDLLETIYSALLREDKMSNTGNHIEQELLNATGFTPKKRYKDRQNYLQALVRAVDALNDEAYEQLSDEAAEWVGQAVKDFKDGKEILDLAVNGGNGHAEHEHEHVHLSEEHAPGMIGALPPAVESGAEVLHETPEKPKRVRKPKLTREPENEGLAKPRRFKPHELNKWGVALGTKAATVCEMIARPQGATMAEIKEATGQTQYNSINRLQRRGHRIVKEGLVIKLVEA